ncbi:MAG: low molecular weight phosphatase family protein [Clostridia bacterium]|nr:low molecular weight phosphatase family protein [Clostridia bacterium]
MNILCICTGNICRSPMLEHLLQKELPKHGLTDVTVVGAGTDTVDGAPPSAHAITVMQEIGVDISQHRSRQITQPIVNETDVFVALTTEHGVKLAFLYGVDPEKILVPGAGIPDPYGRDLNTYRACRDAMLEALPQLIEDLKAL